MGSDEQQSLFEVYGDGSPRGNYLSSRTGADTACMAARIPALKPATGKNAEPG